MADRPSKKPASQRNVNEDRKNRKAWKSKPEDHRGPRQAYRGSRTRGVTLSEVEKVLMDKGSLVNITKPVRSKA